MPEMFHVCKSKQNGELSFEPNWNSNYMSCNFLGNMELYSITFQCLFVFNLSSLGYSPGLPC